MPLNEIRALTSLCSAVRHPCIDSESSVSDTELNETLEFSIKLMMSTVVLSSASSIIKTFPTLVPVTRVPRGCTVCFSELETFLIKCGVELIL